MLSHRIFVGKDTHKFSSAHMTVFPDGTKESLHGHNFQVIAAFDLNRIDFQSLLDFAKVKEALAEQCLAWDQRLLLASRNPHFQNVRASDGELEFTLCEKRYVLPAEEVVLLEVDNIIVETLARAFAKALIRRLKDALHAEVVAGVEVTVTESLGQGASYRWNWGDSTED